MGKIGNRKTLVDNENTSLTSTWFQRNLIDISKMQPEA